MPRVSTRITVLVENTAGQRDLIGEHGLAVWVERNGRRILFDTGQGPALVHNAAALNVDLSAAEIVALSHGHYDHTGGLAHALPQFARATVYAHAGVFRDRFIQRPNGRIQTVRSPIESAEWLRPQVGELVLTNRGPVDLGGGVWLSGDVPRRNDFEDVGGAFYLDRDCTEADTLPDDQAMFIETDQGLVVLAGCAHSGIVNTLEHIQALTGGAHIHAVLGGMHLMSATDRRLDETIRTLTDANVEKIGLAHCTGLRAMAAIYHALPDRCFHCTAGTRLDVP